MYEYWPWAETKGTVICDICAGNIRAVCNSHGPWAKLQASLHIPYTWHIYHWHSVLQHDLRLWSGHRQYIMGRQQEHPQRWEWQWERWNKSSLRERSPGPDVTFEYKAFVYIKLSAASSLANVNVCREKLCNPNEHVRPIHSKTIIFYNIYLCGLLHPPFHPP